MRPEASPRITDVIGTALPYRMAFAGPWIDQPLVYGSIPAPPGSMVVVGLDEPKPKVLWQQSGVNAKGEPFVQLLFEGRILGQFTTEEIRQHALTLLEVAEAAEQDAFIWAWTLEHIGGGPQQAMGLLVDFRKFRDSRTGKQGGPSDAAEWLKP